MNKDKKPLSETHPELAKEAYGWDPNDYSQGSNKKLEWKCNKNHVWLAIIHNRTLVELEKSLIGFALKGIFGKQRPIIELRIILVVQLAHT